MCCVQTAQKWFGDRRMIACFINISDNELTLHLSLPDKVDGWIVNYTHFNKVWC